MTIITSPIAAESGHWYDKDGKPAYTIIGANGKERATTLREARKYNLYPSVTTIMKSAAAPGLEKWKRNNFGLALMTLPRREGESDQEFMDRADLDAQEQSKNAMALGTAIHASLEKAYGLSPISYEAGHQEYVEGVQKAIKDLLGTPPWYSEDSFAHPLGFGGKCDLRSDGITIDFKTKEFDENSLPSTWPEHKMQLAAYREGFKDHSARGFIVFVSTTVKGLVHIVEIPEKDLRQGWRMFQSLLQFWQADKEYAPNVD